MTSDTTAKNRKALTALRAECKQKTALIAEQAIDIKTLQTNYKAANAMLQARTQRKAELESENAALKKVVLELTLELHSQKQDYASRLKMFDDRQFELSKRITKLEANQ